MVIVWSHHDSMVLNPDQHILLNFVLLLNLTCKFVELCRLLLSYLRENLTFVRLVLIYVHYFVARFLRKNCWDPLYSSDQLGCLTTLALNIDRCYSSYGTYQRLIWIKCYLVKIPI